MMNIFLRVLLVLYLLILPLTGISQEIKTAALLGHKENSVLFTMALEYPNFHLISRSLNGNCNDFELVFACEKVGYSFSIQIEGGYCTKVAIFYRTVDKITNALIGIREEPILTASKYSEGNSSNFYYFNNKSDLGECRCIYAEVMLLKDNNIALIYRRNSDLYKLLYNQTQK